MESFPLEPINEIRDINDVILGIDSLITEFTNENSELQEKKEAIMSQREKDSRLLSTNQMWKARSSYKYQHKTFAEQRTNRIESMKTRAREAIMEIELLDNKVESGDDSAANGESSVKTKIKDLQNLYFSVNETFNAIKRLIDESLVDMEDTIQNAAIYEQAKSKLESKLLALEMEYFPESGKPSRSGTNQSEHCFNNRDSLDKDPIDGLIGTERMCMRYVLHSTASQPNQLPLLSDLELKDLEQEQMKIKHVMATVFDKEARDQLDELKQILEEVYPPQSVRDQITYLIETFQKEESAAINRGEEIEALLALKNLWKELQMGVDPPWRRVINPENGLPIYMNDSPHLGTRMSLEHPDFSQIRNKFQNSSIFRGIQFTNYRIGKKATYLQFKLLGNLWTSWESFLPIQTPSSTQTVNLTDFLPFIQTLYESIAEVISKQRKSRAMDCLYNLFIHVAGLESHLNARTAQCLVIFLSKGTCEQKLARLFRLFESRSSSEVHHQEPMISSIDFHLLLQKILLYTKFLDEESASEIEESLKEQAQKMSMAWIRQSDFMNWASEAPLIVDWLRCHEEFVKSKPDEVKHQAKCNQCTVYPIEGILFKCQKCPNFDLCDACYLVKAFHHKETHSFISIVEPVTANKELLQGTILRKLTSTISRNKQSADANSSFKEKSSTLTPNASVKSNRGSTKIKLDPNDPSWTNHPVAPAVPQADVITATQLPLPRQGKVTSPSSGHVTARYDVSTYNSLRLPGKTPEAVYQGPTSAVYASVDNSIYNYGNEKFILPNIPTNRVLGNWPVSLLPPGDEHADIRNLCRTLRGKAPVEEIDERIDPGREKSKLLVKGVHVRSDDDGSSSSNLNSTERSYEGVSSPQSTDAKNLSDKLSELQNKFCNLYEQVQTLSKTAGVPLQIGSLGEINYDSILSIKFANENELFVVYESEILYEVPPLQTCKAYVTGEPLGNEKKNNTTPVLTASTEYSYSKWSSQKFCEVEEESVKTEVTANQESKFQKYCWDIVNECLNEILALKQLSDWNVGDKSVDLRIGVNETNQKMLPEEEKEKCGINESNEMGLENFCRKLVDESFQDAMKSIENQEPSVQLK